MISPLRVLMRAQVAKWRGAGISCACILRRGEMDKQEIRDIQDGRFTLVYASPEALTEDFWFNWLKRQTVCLLAVDEAHCVTTWGTQFRDGYRRIDEIRAVFSNVPFLAMTATATSDIVSDLASLGGCPSFNIVAAVPDRSIDKVTAVFGSIVRVLASKGKAKLVEMFHSKVDDVTQIDVPTDFCRDESDVRCLVSTVAFGLGMDVRNVKYVILWGPPESLIEYWQQIGRCARNGMNGVAIVYQPPFSTISKYCKEDILGMVKAAQTECIRNRTLSAFRLTGLHQKDIDDCCGKPSCCSYCSSHQPKHTDVDG